MATLQIIRFAGSIFVFLIQLSPCAMTEWYEPLLDNGWIPIPILRVGIRKQLANRLQEMHSKDCTEAMSKKEEFIARLKEGPIAVGTSSFQIFSGFSEAGLSVATDKANEQHYEVTSSFFLKCLGPRMKYSCCLYPTGTETLEEAEVAMLDSYVQKAKVIDGMDILDLGCGWGSLSIFLAEVISNVSPS